MLSMLNAASLANSAELTSNNVLTGGLFDKINGLKASWDKTLELGDHSTNLKTTYKHDGHDEVDQDHRHEDERRNAEDDGRIARG